MIEILGVKLTYEAVLFLGLFIAEQIIAALPIKANSTVQLITGGIEAIKPLRKEDEKVAKVAAALKELLKD